jgi:glycosidase
VRSRVRRPKRHADDLGIHGLPGDVSPWDIRFDLHDVAFCEPLGDGHYRFRVWTEPELTEAAVVVRDDEITEWPMEPIRTRRFTIWEVVVGPVATDAEFSLAFRTHLGRPVYYTPGGVAVAVERLDRWRLPDSDPIDVPSWAKGSVMYQIFPERFANGDPSNDPDGTVAWGSVPEPIQFQGGDLAGVTQRLDHLVWLGVDVVYLNPIFTSPSNHKYDAVDYFSVDPALGGDDALRELVSAAHDRGIKVILDASLNHAHPRFFAFADLIEHGESSLYSDWFDVHTWPLSIGYRPHLMGERHPMRRWLERWPAETGLPVVELTGEGRPVEPSYDAWYGVATMPRLNLANPQARRYALDVARYWVREFGVDGWRMDVARYVDPDFWEDFRSAVRDENPEAYLIAEIMGDAGAWLQGTRFDATMDYTFRSLCVRFLATNEIDGPEFLDEAARSVFQYAWPVTLACQSLIGSHDTPRFLTEAGGEPWRLQLATVLQLTMPGMPGIYYGDELEMEGGNDPGCRGAFPIDVDPTTVENAHAIHELAGLRRNRPELADGAWRPVDAGTDFVAFERIGARRSLVVINRSATAVTLRTGRRWARVKFGRGSLDGSSVTVEARSAVVVVGR